MNRLTRRYETGIFDSAKRIEYVSTLKDTTQNIEDIVERLAQYEDLGLTPAQIAGVDNLYAAKCKEVAELQRELENSVKLPCAYNDTMYWIVRGHIREVWFKDIRCDYGYKPQIICRYIDNLKTKETAICEVDQIGKTLFLTRDAAEKALSEVKA